jgi:pyruvate carboxylase subunit B
VTPTSQIVGIQAVMNVLSGERYKNVTKEVKEYIKGYYGRPPAPINKEVAKKIIGNAEVIDSRPADLLKPELENFRAEGEKMGIIKKDEDILTFALYPAVAPKFLRGEVVEELLEKPKENESPTAASIPTEYNVEVDGELFDVKVVPTGFMEIGSSVKAPNGPVEGGISSSMQGMILKLKVAKNDKVNKGDIVAVLEAMKMENDIHAPDSGTVEEIFIEEGDTVSTGDTLMIIK